MNAESDDALPRLQFPAEEVALAWLTPLLDAYHVADRGVAEGISRAQHQGRTLACAKGCSACCRSHTTIPVYPLELVGMTWFAIEKIEPPLRASLKSQLRAHRQGQPCPFLVDGICSVHPLRPVACGQFNVFGRPCAEGEAAQPPPGRAGADPELPGRGVLHHAAMRRASKDGAA